jgi:hypothetical protein
MRTEKTFLYLFLLATMAGLPACYPLEKDIAYEDLDIALTVYDKDYYSPEGNNYFQDFQTFTVPDTVIHIIEAGVIDEISRDYDKYVIEQVRSNLLKLGFTEQVDPETNPPDLTVTVSVTTSEHIVYDWYPYWAWYYVFVKKGAAASSVTVGNNYPWQPYYGSGTSYSYTAGTVILEMVDVAKVDPSSEEIPVIWAGLLNGAVGGDAESMKNRLSTGIDRCFNQSPYLFK